MSAPDLEITQQTETGNYSRQSPYNERHTDLKKRSAISLDILALESKKMHLKSI